MLKNKIGAAIMSMGVISGGVFATMAAGDTSTTANNFSNKSARVMQNLTDAQKSIMTQAKALFDQGKKTEAEKLLADNGITIPKRGENGKGGMHEDRSKMDAAIVSGDYQAFKLLAVNSPLANISESVFKSLQAPTLAQKQARESIDSILTAAGVTRQVKDVVAQ